MRQQWNREKATEIVVYLAEWVEPRPGWVKSRTILDIIYQADKLHLERHGIRTISRDDYAAGRRGVYPVRCNDLLYADDSDAFKFGDEGELVVLRPADVMKLSRSDTECLDETLARWQRSSHRSWRSGVMDWAWHVTTDSGTQFSGGRRDNAIPVSLLGVILGLPNAIDILKDMYTLGHDPCEPPEPDTLDEALKRIGDWGDILRHAIEHGVAIRPEVLLVSYHNPSWAEIAYGKTPIPMGEAIDNREG
jgi:hypothetical protein